MTGLLDNPINPFTKNPIYQPDAKDGKQLVLYTDNWSAESNSGNTFTNCIWYSLNNKNVLEKENWRKEE